jgi:hypothetical protein
MRIKTTYKFTAKTEELWPLLFNSRMDSKQPCYFLCGLPKPVECRLDHKEGGVGKTRECVSDKGVIKQNILAWEPNKKLSFELRETDIYFGPFVKSIVENFELSQVGDNTTIITRVTDFQLTKHKLFITIPMAIGLKAIHRYVFKNWDRISLESKK